MMQYLQHSPLAHQQRLSVSIFSALSPWRPLAWRSCAFSILFLTYIVNTFNLSRAWSQDWKFVKSVKIGNLAERAVVARGGDEIYIANRGSCNLSVINTKTNESIRPIELGKTPKALAAGHDGQVYVLAQDKIGETCALPANEDGNYWVGVVSEAKHIVESWVGLPGRRWDDIKVASDGRAFLTRVLSSDDPGVYVLDTATRKLQPGPVIEGSEAPCATNLALAEKQNEIFVSYQCGRQAHDPIGIYCLSAGSSCLKAYATIAEISGFPNVSGPMSMSPDEGFLWEYGDDACSGPEYTDHTGCPGYNPATQENNPVRILNLIDTYSLVVRTYPLKIGDGRFVSFALDGDAYIGTGNGIKVVKKPGVGTPEKLPLAIPSDDVCHGLGAVGQIIFTEAGGNEFMYAVASDVSAVCVLERPVPAASASVLPAGPAIPGKMYAIAIGIESFDSDQIPDLNYPASEAAHVAAELERQYGFDVVTLPQHLQYENPSCEGKACSVSKDQVTGLFKSLLFENGRKRNFGRQDELLVFISGHGARWTDPDGVSYPYLVTSDSKSTCLTDKNGIPIENKDGECNENPRDSQSEVDYREIWDMIEQSNIRHVLFVVDSCLAGFFGSDVFGGPTFQVALRDGKPFIPKDSLSEMLKRNSGVTRKYLSASPFSTEKVSDKPNFTDKFLQALESLSGRTAGYFTFDSLLTEMVDLEPQPRPSSFSLDDSAHGDFIFIPHSVDSSQLGLGNTSATQGAH